MMNGLLYVNGTLVDLGPNTIIPLTFQAGDIGDLNIRVADYSATINIPKTSRNKATFGNINLVNSLSTMPYRKATIDYTLKGMNVIKGGSGIITESSRYYKLNIYNGLIDFFGAIDGKNVDDMDFGVYQEITDAYIESIRLSLGTFSAPVIDQGTLFPARQTLGNPTFTGTGSWSNGGTGLAWGLNIIGVTQLNIVANSGTANNSQFLSQEYKTFDGFRYRLTLTFELPVNDASATLDFLNLYIGAQLVGQVTSISNTTGTFTIDEYVTSVGDHDNIQIYSEFLVANPGDELRIVLKSIKVTDVEGVIDIKAPYYIPLISYSQVIAKIITDAGYIPSLIMTDQAYYEKLYMSFSKDEYEYPQRLIDKMNFRAIASGSQVLVIADALEHAIEFPVIIESGLYAWYNQVDTFEVPAWLYSIQYEVRARIIVDISFAGGATAAEFYFTIDGVTQTLLETVPSAALDRYVFTFDSNVIVTDATPKEFKLTVVRAGGAGSITVSVIEAEFWSEVSPIAFGIVNLSALILPTITQKEFMKDFMMRFGILAKQKTGQFEIPAYQSPITLPALSTGVNIAGPGTNWTTGSNPSVTLVGGGPPAASDSDTIAFAYAFVTGREYTFILDIDYNFHPNTLVANIVFVVLDASDVELYSDASGNLSSSTGTYSGPVNFIAPAGAVKYGIRVSTFGVLSPSSTVDIDLFTSTETIPAQILSGNQVILSEMQNTLSRPYDYVDWTAKRDVTEEEPIKFESKNYAQENIFQDIIGDELVTGYKATLDIDDETIAASKVFFSSIMAAVTQNNNNGMRLSRIPFFDLTDDEPDYIPSPALLYLRGPRDGDSVVMYDGDVKTDYLLCVYNDPTFEFNTTWEYFLRNYYPLIEASLQRSKVVTRQYNLNQLDIAKLDIFKLVFDANQLYLINRISKYMPGKATSVDLFKVLG
jgi:hypothetical protein